MTWCQMYLISLLPIAYTGAWAFFARLLIPFADCQIRPKEIRDCAIAGVDVTSPLWHLH